MGEGKEGDLRGARKWTNRRRGEDGKGGNEREEAGACDVGKKSTDVYSERTLARDTFNLT